MGHVFDLVLCESFTFHQFAQVGNIELRVKDLLSHWSDLINFYDSLGEVSLLLPLIESVTGSSRNDMTKHGSFLLISIPISMNLSSEMHIVLM